MGKAPSTSARTKSKPGGTKESKRIVVNLATRTLEASQGKNMVYTFSCLVGQEGHETTPGHYTVLEKDRNRRSRKYNAPMNFAMKFSEDWKAIHESEHFGLRNIGVSLGMTSLGSHGCIGLSHDDAKVLFDWTPLGTPVIVNLK